MSIPNPTPPLTCSACGLTAPVLRDTGRMGCAHCYITFAAMVAEAAHTLHAGSVSLSVAPAPVETDALPTPTLRLPDPDAPFPWPTRRAGKA